MCVSISTEEIRKGGKQMKRKVTAQTVIVHFYALYLKKRPPDAETLREANLLIEKCNENMAREGDKYVSDALKQVDAEDYNYRFVKMARSRCAHCGTHRK